MISFICGNYKIKQNETQDHWYRKWIWWLSETGEGREGKMDEGNLAGPTSSYKVNKPGRCNEQHGDYG